MSADRKISSQETRESEKGMGKASASLSASHRNKTAQLAKLLASLDRDQPQLAQTLRSLLGKLSASPCGGANGHDERGAETFVQSTAHSPALGDQLDKLLESTAHSPALGDQLDKLLESTDNLAETGHEIQKFMDSVESILASSSDEVIYDRYMGAGATEGKNFYMPLAGDRPSPEEWEIMCADKLGSAKSRRHSKSPKPNRQACGKRRLSILLFSSFLISAAALGVGFYSSSHRTADSRQASPKSIESPISLLPRNQLPDSPIAPVQAIGESEVQPAPSTDGDSKKNQDPQGAYRLHSLLATSSHAELKSALAAHMDDVETVKGNLALLANSNVWSDEDLPLLQSLYAKHAATPAISELVIQAIGVIGSDVANEWLNQKLQEMQADRFVVAKTLWQSGGQDARRKVFRILQDEKSKASYLELACYLSRTSAGDREVNEVLIGQFYSRTNPEIRRQLLSSIAMMRLPQRPFFLGVAASSSYDYSVRLAAVDSLLVHLNSTGNSRSEINETIMCLVELSASLDEGNVLCEKIRGAIERLTE